MFEIDHVENAPITICYKMDQKTYDDLCNALRLCNILTTKIAAAEWVREYDYFDDEYKSELKHRTYTLQELGGANADLTRFDESKIGFKISFNDEDANTSLSLVPHELHKSEDGYYEDGYYTKAHLEVKTTEPNFDLGAFFQRKTHGKFKSELLPDSPLKIETGSKEIPKLVPKMYPTFWIPCNSQSVADFEDKAYWRFDPYNFDIGIIRIYRESGANSSLEYIMPSLWNCDFMRIFWDSQHPAPKGTAYLFTKEYPRLGTVRECSWDFKQHLTKQEIQKYDDFINGVCYLAYHSN